MRQVRVHDHNIVAGRLAHPVNVSSPKAQFLLPGCQNDTIGAVDSLETLCNFQSSVWTSIIDDNDFVGEALKILDQQPNYNRQIFTLIVRRK